MIVPSSLNRKELITLSQHFQLTHAITFAFNMKIDDPATRVRRLIAITLNCREECVDPRLEGILDILLEGYGKGNRRSGAPKVLHPLRVMSIVTMAHQIELSESIWLDQVGALIHDFNEDFEVPIVEHDSYPPEGTLAHILESKYKSFRGKLESQNIAWVIGERKEFYTRRPFDDKSLNGYCQYLWDLLQRSHPTTGDNLEDLMRVKLADRIDNTLDHRSFYTTGTEYNFYRTIFDVLFVPGFKGPQIDSFMSPLTIESGSDTLMQLFKSMIFLSLIRKYDIEQRKKISYHFATIRLFRGLVVAGLRVAQLALLELLTDIDNVTKVKEVLTHSQCAGTINDIGSIRSNGGMGNISIDGLLIELFERTAKKEKSVILTSIFEHKERLALVLVMLIATFAKFLTDRQFYIHGVDGDGVHPE